MSENKVKKDEVILSQGAQNFNTQRAIDIKIREDKLSAIMIISPIKLFGQMLSINDIEDSFQRYGISKDRVNYSAVNQILTQVSKATDPTKQMVNIEAEIATGFPAVPGVDGWLNFYHPRASRVVINEDGAADFRNINRYIHVNKDEKVASFFEGINGKAGMDVFGKPIIPPSINRPKLKIGNNIIVKLQAHPEVAGAVTKEHFASSSGVIYLTDESVSVASELQIDSDVGLGTGNINYDGSIVVKGSIEHGTHVICSGSMQVGGNVESDIIKIGGNLEIRGGLKTKKQNVIKIQGSLHAKFIENAHLEVIGDIILEGSIVNSKILCLGSVFLNNQNGIVLNSEINAYNGASIYKTGSEAGLETVIEVGHHFINERLFEQNTEDLKNTEKEIPKMEAQVMQIKRTVIAMKNKLDAEKKEKFKEVFNIYQAMIAKKETLIKKLEDLKHSRFHNGVIRLIVRGGSFPGTLIKYRRQVEKIATYQSTYMMVFQPGQEKAVMTAWTDPDRNSKKK